MEPPRPARKAWILWALILLAIAYTGLLNALPRLTGTALLDGSLGVLLGLYICSHPAANAIDVLFFQRGVLRQVSSKLSGLGWVALNALTLVVGWLLIVIGTTRFVGPVG